MAHQHGMPPLRVALRFQATKTAETFKALQVANPSSLAELLRSASMTAKQSNDRLRDLSRDIYRILYKDAESTIAAAEKRSPLQQPVLNLSPEAKPALRKLLSQLIHTEYTKQQGLAFLNIRIRHAMQNIMKGSPSDLLTPDKAHGLLRELKNYRDLHTTSPDRAFHEALTRANVPMTLWEDILPEEYHAKARFLQRQGHNVLPLDIQDTANAAMQHVRARLATQTALHDTGKTPHEAATTESEVPQLPGSSPAAHMDADHDAEQRGEESKVAIHDAQPQPLSHGSSQPDLLAKSLWDVAVLAAPRMHFEPGLHHLLEGEQHLGNTFSTIGRRDHPMTILTAPSPKLLAFHAALHEAQVLLQPTASTGIPHHHSQATLTPQLYAATMTKLKRAYQAAWNGVVCTDMAFVKDITQRLQRLWHCLITYYEGPSTWLVLPPDFLFDIEVIEALWNGCLHRCFWLLLRRPREAAWDDLATAPTVSIASGSPMQDLPPVHCLLLATNILVRVSQAMRVKKMAGRYSFAVVADMPLEKVRQVLIGDVQKWMKALGAALAHAEPIVAALIQSPRPSNFLDAVQFLEDMRSALEFRALDTEEGLEQCTPEHRNLILLAKQMVHRTVAGMLVGIRRLEFQLHALQHQYVTGERAGSAAMTIAAETHAHDTLPFYDVPEFYAGPEHMAALMQDVKVEFGYPARVGKDLVAATRAAAEERIKATSRKRQSDIAGDGKRQRLRGGWVMLLSE